MLLTYTRLTDWLTEVAYLFASISFVKKTNLGSFCNTQNDFGVGQQHQVSDSFWDTSLLTCIKVSIHFFPSQENTFIFQSERYKWKVNVVQCSAFLIMSGSCSYNCVLIFDLVDLHTLVSELKSICICFQPEKYKWNMQYNDFLVHLSMFSCIFSKLKIFRCPKIFSRDLERSSKVKDLFEDLCNVFQRYCKKKFFFNWNEQAKDL